MTTEPQSAAPAPVRVVPPLHPKFFQLDTAGQVVSVWVAATPAGVTFEDTLNPEYWTHIASRLRPLAKICVFPEDGSWEAELRVRSVGTQWAKVHPIRHEVMPVVPAPAQSDAFAVDWGGPVLKYRIRRVSDGANVETGFVDKAAAYTALTELMKRAA